MSVSFYLALKESDSRGWKIECYLDDHAHNDTYSSWDDVCSAYRHMLTTNEVIQGECYTSQVFDVDASCDFSLANTNARMVLACLGFGHVQENLSEWEAAEALLQAMKGQLNLDGIELYGSCSGEDLLGRIAVVRALEPDVSVSASTSVGANGAKLIDHGRDASYLPGRLDAMERLAHLAVITGRDVTWA